MTRRELDALFASCMKEIESLSSEECASIREEYRRDRTEDSLHLSDEVCILCPYGKV